MEKAGAKLISKKFKLLLINSGLFYRYASKLIIEKKPKKCSFLKKSFAKTTYKKIASLKLHSQK